MTSKKHCSAPENDITAPETCSRAPENYITAPESRSSASKNDITAPESYSPAPENDITASESLSPAVFIGVVGFCFFYLLCLEEFDALKNNIKSLKVYLYVTNEGTDFIKALLVQFKVNTYGIKTYIIGKRSACYASLCILSRTEANN